MSNEEKNIYERHALIAINIINNLKLKKKLTKQSLIIFDVDDTLIFAKTNTLNLPIATIYHYAKLLDINIILITSRIGTSENIELTQQQLKSFFLNDHCEIYFKDPNFFNEDEKNSFKKVVRQHLVSRGFEIIMTIGDKKSDIDQPNNGIPIKLPEIQ
jgi:predicted secreted acid phosphatase